MTLERSKLERGQPTVTKFEIWPTDKDFEKNLVSFLVPPFNADQAEQIAFLLKNVITDNEGKQDDGRNRCNDQTQQFGLSLNEKFGGEESFLELQPGVSYFDMQSQGQLEKIAYRGDYHSVGMISSPETEEKKRHQIIIDFTYFTVNHEWQKRKMLIIKIDGDEETVKQTLNQFYGGNWKKAYTLVIDQDGQPKMRYSDDFSFSLL